MEPTAETALRELGRLVGEWARHAANRRYYQLHSDDRGVCRVYEMSIDEGEWRL